jgi:WG containing repeat
MKKIILLTCLVIGFTTAIGQTLTEFRAGNGKVGFKDATGTIVVQAKYDKVTAFTNGFAALYLGENMGLVNSMGKIVIPIKDIGFSITRMALGLIPFGSGSGTHNQGVMDTLGRIIVPAKYDLCKIVNNTTFIVIKNNLCGVYNTGSAYRSIDVKTKVVNTGLLTLPLVYSDITSAYSKDLKRINNLLLVSKKDKSGQELFGLCNYDGLELIPCKYELIYFDNGKARVRNKSEIFYVDTAGARVD